MPISPTNRRLGIALASVSISSGAAGELVAPDQPIGIINLLSALVTLGLIFAWYRLDARDLGYRRTALLNAMVIAVALIAVPYYLFRSRGFARGLRATGIFVAVVVGDTLLNSAGAYAAYYAKAI